MQSTHEQPVITIHKEVIDLDEAIKRFEISPIIKRFGTWVVSTYGVECLSAPYRFPFNRVDEPDWLQHMKEKRWVILDDLHDALSFAQELKLRRADYLKEGKPLKVFLCHAKEDKLSVRNIYNRLMVNGIQPWFDEENILPGQDWTLEIKKAVRTSDVVVVFLSQKSVDKTGYVQKEIKIALDAADERPEGKIFIIPARIEECIVPDRLSNIQWVDLYLENGLDRLMRSLYICAQG